MVHLFFLLFTFCLVSTVLLLLLIFRGRKGKTEDMALLKDSPRDNLFYYDEEGGGEEDQVRSRCKITDFFMLEKKINV